jgi:hypothetical protein
MDFFHLIFLSGKKKIQNMSFLKIYGYRALIQLTHSAPSLRLYRFNPCPR